MRNKERPWERTRWRIDDTFDGALALPPILYVFGLLQADQELIGIALWVWALGVLAWTPWIVIRVLMNDPPGDGWRAVAILGFGLDPWAFFPPLLGLLSTFEGQAVAFPVVFIWSAAAMAMAAWGWPRIKTEAGRRRLLAGAALVYGLWAAALFTAIAFGFAREWAFVLAIATLLAGGSAVTCLGLVSASMKPWKAPGEAPPE